MSVCYTCNAYERQLKKGTIKIPLLNQCRNNEHSTSLVNVAIWVPSLERDVQTGKIDRDD